MPRRVDFSAELIFVCNSLEAGGIERVVSTLANEWSRGGRKVCVVTMHDRRKFFALPSRVEGTTNALLEAMGRGLPVVVSDGPPGPQELVEDGETGLIVPVNDAHALAEVLGRLARDEALCRRLGEAARERVSEYDLPRALVAWESVVGLGGGSMAAARELVAAREL